MSHDQAGFGAPGPPKISIIVPTFNERDNVRPLINSLDRAMDGTPWEVIFVDDDSPDQTTNEIRAVAQSDPRVRCIQRIGRRGLSSACVEGMLSSSAPYVAVMDADGQHDESLLPRMLRSLEEAGLDLVIGSRYVEGGSVGQWDSNRVWISRLSTGIANTVLTADLSDPMSGFFAIRRDVLDELVHNLSAVGFKILLDIFASAKRPLRFKELPFEFRTRTAGESKLDNRAALDFLTLLLEKRFGNLIPARLVYFSLIGGTGVGVHLLAFTSMFHALEYSFVTSQMFATLIAMVGNYWLNNLITYRDRQLTGWAWFRGLAIFCLACSVGAITNVGVASYIYSGISAWLPSTLAGVLMSTIWNYATTSFLVWRRAT